MDTSTNLQTLRPTSTSAPLLDVVVPVHNEQHSLPGCIHRLRSYLDQYVPYSSRITIADNASADATLEVARQLAADVPGVRVVHLPAKGRGGALHQVWGASDAAVLVYMDVDLSTGPRCCRWSHRWSAVTATCRSAADWPAGPGSSGAPSASSSRAATTCCCAP
jgi:cellulose synthase/poly-beta-1,6-N-acetylglucosamine synthase-like glycosyltransferase